jgi:hypothetical protein
MSTQTMESAMVFLPLGKSGKVFRATSHAPYFPRRPAWAIASVIRYIA